MSIRKIWRKFFLITRRDDIAWHQGHRLFEGGFFRKLQYLYYYLVSMMKLSNTQQIYQLPSQPWWNVLPDNAPLPCTNWPFSFYKDMQMLYFNVQLRVLHPILRMLIYAHQGVCLTPNNTIFNPCDHENKLRFEVMIMSDFFIYTKLTRRVGSVCVYCNKNP